LADAILLSNGASFLRAEDRIREYCEVEVYRDINYRGGYDDRRSVTDHITSDDLEAANNLYANLSSLERVRILHDEKIPPLLAPVMDAELGDLKEEEWEAVKATIAPLLAELMSIRYVRLAKSTKILHLKRPHLFPILDSLVVRFLTGTDMDAYTFSPEELLRLALVSFDVARKDLVSNRAAFADLRERLSDLPTPLTAVRMHDILCWTEQKWVREENPSAKYGTASRSLDQSLRQVGAPTLQTPSESSDSKNSAKPDIPGEIKTTREFRQIIGRAEGFIVITGTAPPRIHRVLCPLLTDDRFNENVIIKEGRGGRYYWRGNFLEACKEFAAVACKRCDPRGFAPRRDA